MRIDIHGIFLDVVLIQNSLVDELELLDLVPYLPGLLKVFVRRGVYFFELLLVLFLFQLLDFFESPQNELVHDLFRLDRTEFEVQNHSYLIAVDLHPRVVGEFEHELREKNLKNSLLLLPEKVFSELSIIIYLFQDLFKLGDRIWVGLGVVRFQVLY